MFRWSIRKDSVAQIEYVAGTTADLCQDILGSCVDKLVCAEQDRGIEIALDCCVAEESPCFVYRDSPIYTEHVSACFSHLVQYPRRSYAKVYSRNTPEFQAFEYLSVEGEHKFLVVRW